MHVPGQRPAQTAEALGVEPAAVAIAGAAACGGGEQVLDHRVDRRPLVARGTPGVERLGLLVAPGARLGQRLEDRAEHRLPGLGILDAGAVAERPAAALGPSRARQWSACWAMMPGHLVRQVYAMSGRMASSPVASASAEHAPAIRVRDHRPVIASSVLDERRGIRLAAAHPARIIGRVDRLADRLRRRRAPAPAGATRRPPGSRSAAMAVPRDAAPARAADRHGRARGDGARPRRHAHGDHRRAAGRRPRRRRAQRRAARPPQHPPGAAPGPAADVDGLVLAAAARVSRRSTSSCSTRSPATPSAAPGRASTS